MGCVFSNLFSERTENEHNVFKVVNIDQDGNPHNPGRIEITTENLLLYQGKKEPLSWPIRSLRRYGVENDVFSFEVGRRCPTGEGIFAFRCDQAEQLFRLLQTNIQRSCANSNSNAPQGDSGQLSNYLEPRIVNSRQNRLESVGSTNSYPHTPLSPCQPPSLDLMDVNRNKSDKKNSTGVLSDDSPFPTSPVYENVAPDGDDAENSSSSPNAYIYFVTEKSTKQYPPPLMLRPVNGEVYEEHSPNNIKYAMLDFDDNTSSPVVKTPIEEEKTASKYSVIDLQKTWALSQSTKPNIENDIGCTRRTRHNSNLFGVYR